jgi:hypothetical protein
MNAQERDLLASFLREVTASRPQHKDPVAESMVREALACSPDAMYVLVQRALAAEIALRSSHVVRSGAGVPGEAPGGAAELSLLRQAAATGLGVSAGIVAGGFLLEGLRSVLSDTDSGDVMDWF